MSHPPQTHPYIAQDPKACLAEFEQKYADLTPEQRIDFLVQALELIPEQSSLLFRYLLHFLEESHLQFKPEMWNKASRIAVIQGNSDAFQELLRYAPQQAEHFYFDSLTQLMVEYQPQRMSSMFGGLLRYSDSISRRMLSLHQHLLTHASSWTLNLDEARLIRESWQTLRYHPKLTSQAIHHAWMNSVPREPSPPISGFGRLALSGLIEMEIDILKHGGGWVQTVYVDRQGSLTGDPLLIPIDQWILKHPIWKDALDPTELEKLLLNEALPKGQPLKPSSRI